MQRSVFVLLVALAAALAAAGCASLSPTVPVVHDQAYPAVGIEVVDIEHRNGMVDVTGWDGQEIRVRVFYGRRIDNISVETAGDRMTVRTLPAGVVGINGPEARYEVSVPRALRRAEVRTSNGQTRVADFNGTVAAETSNGAITLSAL